MDQQSPEDPRKYQKAGRVAATSVIWGISGGMLGICIPLVMVTKSGVILPLATIIGAAVATFAVWNAKNNDSQVQQLEERIALLEKIFTQEDLDNN